MNPQQPYPPAPQQAPGDSYNPGANYGDGGGNYGYPPAGAPPNMGYPPPGMPPQAEYPSPQAAQMPGQPAGQSMYGYGPAGNGPAPATSVAPKSNPNSTQNTLEIAEIRDGIVIMNDGSFRSVIMAKSINFDLMSPQEREAVEYSYQGFLNSLYFPVQITVRSSKVDLGPYIQKLDKIRSEHENMLLALLMEDYINYMDQLAQQTNIMDKKFYIVVPYFPTVDMQKTLADSKKLLSGLGGLFSPKPAMQVTITEGDLEKAKEELRNRVQAVLGGLMQCGIQGLPLDTQELIELYYDAYNPDTATRQEITNFNDMNAAVVTKGQGQARQPNLERQMQ